MNYNKYKQDLFPSVVVVVVGGSKLLVAVSFTVVPNIITNIINTQNTSSN